MSPKKGMANKKYMFEVGTTDFSGDRLVFRRVVALPPI